MFLITVNLDTIKFLLREILGRTPMKLKSLLTFFVLIFLLHNLKIACKFRNLNVSHEIFLHEVSELLRVCFVTKKRVEKNFFVRMDRVSQVFSEAVA